jgi:hypothetical protein
MSNTVRPASDIRPFQVNIPDEALEDLRRRIAAMNWPEKETVADQSQGVPLAMIQKLARYGRVASSVTGQAWGLEAPQVTSRARAR